MQSTEKFPLGGTNLNNQESDLLSVSDEQKITWALEIASGMVCFTNT